MNNAATFSAVGPAFYRSVTAGAPGASATPLAFPLPPWLRPGGAHHTLS